MVACKLYNLRTSSISVAAQGQLLGRGGPRCFRGRLGLTQHVAQPLREPSRPGRSGCNPVRAAAQPEGFGEKLMRVAGKVRDGLPIVGLWSRLTATGGGVGSEELMYPEYCRKLIDNAPEGFDQAVFEWEQLYKPEGTRRHTLLCLFMATSGPGLVGSRQIILAARRLRVTFDAEMEMDRFQMTREEAAKAYDLVERPRGTQNQCINIAVDSLCTLGPGLKDGMPLKGKPAELLVKIVTAAFPDVEDAEAQVRESLDTRSTRAKDYLAS